MTKHRNKRQRASNEPFNINVSASLKQSYTEHLISATQNLSVDVHKQLAHGEQHVHGYRALLLSAVVAACGVLMVVITMHVQQRDQLANTSGLEESAPVTQDMLDDIAAEYLVEALLNSTSSSTVVLTDTDLEILTKEM